MGRTIMTTMTTLRMRWMLLTDWQQLRAYEEVLPSWMRIDEQAFLEMLRRRQVIGSVVVDESQKILAYTLYELKKHYFELLVLRFDPWGVQGQTHQFIMKKLKSKLRYGKRLSLRMWVDERDLELQILLREHQFRATQVSRGRFGDYDGYRMVFRVENGE